MFLCHHPKIPGFIIHSKLIFDEDLKMASLNISESLGLLQKLQDMLPRSALITIYKALVRPYLDYGDILYYQAYNMSFHQKLESNQYNPCLTITSATRGTSKKILCQELGLKSLQLWHWYWKLGMFYKIKKFIKPKFPNTFLN